MSEAIFIPQHKGSCPSLPRSLSLSKRPSQTCKEAAPIIWNVSYADGIADQSHRLPFTVMASHVNLPATDHSEMAPDKDRFPSCFLALCAKALSEAKFKLDCDHNKSMNNNCKLESWERLVKSTSSALLQNKWSICHFVGRRSLKISLESAPIHTDYNPSAKILISSGFASSCGSVRETLPLPNKTSSRGHLVRQTGFSRTKFQRVGEAAYVDVR